MSKLIVTPFNREGEPVKRGVVTISAQSTRAQVAERVIDSVTREGVGDISSAEVTFANGLLAYAFDVRSKELVQTDGEGSEQFAIARYPSERLKEIVMTEAAENTELTAEQKKAAKEAERAAAKQAKEEAKAAAKAAKEQEKADKAAAKEAEKASKVKEKGPTKKDRVIALLTGAGASVTQIATDLGVSDTAARSLISDVKRAGHVVDSRKDESKTTIYFVTGAPAPVATEEVADEGQAE